MTASLLTMLTLSLTAGTWGVRIAVPAERFSATSSRRSVRAMALGVVKPAAALRPRHDARQVLCMADDEERTADGVPSASRRAVVWCAAFALLAPAAASAATAGASRANLVQSFQDRYYYYKYYQVDRRPYVLMATPRYVTTLAHRIQNRGSHEVEVPIGLTPGKYYPKIESESFYDRRYYANSRGFIFNETATPEISDVAFGGRTSSFSECLMATAARFK